jgi:glycosyltransferase involved in cell wall biosynthesis
VKEIHQTGVVSTIITRKQRKRSSGSMLTVLLATRNRARTLRDVLGAFCQLESPPSGWKLVVVDNGSTDQTTQVIASFANRLPLHSVFESKIGKNFALNTGLELVEGDLAVFTDDDVFPRANWLTEMRKAVDAQLAYSMFGGAILPRWEVPPPAWIRWLDLGPIFTLTDLSLKEGPLAPNLIPIVQGPNMAIRTNIFQSGTRFDPSIGPSGSSYPMGSETELLMRLGRQGHKAWHVQNAVVEHLVRKEQLDKTWVMRRAVRWGRGRLRMSQNVKFWLGFPRHLFRDIPKEILLMMAARVSFRQEAHLRSRWRLNILRGIASEARVMARERRAQGRSGSSISRLKCDS